MCFPDSQTSRFAAEALQNYYGNSSPLKLIEIFILSSSNTMLVSMYEAATIALMKETELLDTAKQLVAAMRNFNLHRDLNAMEYAARTLYYITATGNQLLNFHTLWCKRGIDI